MAVGCGSATPPASLRVSPNVTSPESLIQVRHGLVVEQAGSGFVIIVWTSEMMVLPFWLGESPGTPTSELIVTIDGERPWLRTNSPQLALDIASAATIANE